MRDLREVGYADPISSFEFSAALDLGEAFPGDLRVDLLAETEERRVGGLSLALLRHTKKESLRGCLVLSLTKRIF